MGENACPYRKSNLSLSNRGQAPYSLRSGCDCCVDKCMCMLERNPLTGLVFCRFIWLPAWWFCVPHACCMLSLGLWYLQLFSRNGWFSSSHVHYGIKSEWGSGFMAQAFCLPKQIPFTIQALTHTHGNTVINTLFASVVVYFQTPVLKAMITALSRQSSWM